LPVCVQATPPVFPPPTHGYQLPVYVKPVRCRPDKNRIT
jgi:hypothetical protein